MIDKTVDLLLSLEHSTPPIGAGHAIEGDLASRAEDLILSFSASVTSLNRLSARSVSTLLSHYLKTAALLLRYGAYEEAEEVLDRGSATSAAFARSGHQIAAAALIRLHIWKGRMWANRGDGDVALSIFDPLLQMAAASTPQTLAGLRIDASDFSNILAADASLRDLIFNSYLMECGRALLLEKQYDRLLGFIEQLETSLEFHPYEPWRQPAQEFRVMAMIGLKQFEPALGALDVLSRKVETPLSAPVHLLMADVLCVSRQIDRSKAKLELIESLLPGMERQSSVPKKLLFYTAYVLALEHARMENWRASHERMKDALDFAVEINNRSAIVRALVFLLTMSMDARSSAAGSFPGFWYEQLKHILQTTRQFEDRAMAFCLLSTAATKLEPSRASHYRKECLRLLPRMKSMHGVWIRRHALASLDASAKETDDLQGEERPRSSIEDLCAILNRAELFPNLVVAAD